MLPPDLQRLHVLGALDDGWTPRAGRRDPSSPRWTLGGALVARLRGARPRRSFRGTPSRWCCPTRVYPTPPGWVRNDPLSVRITEMYVRLPARSRPPVPEGMITNLVRSARHGEGCLRKHEDRARSRGTAAAIAACIHCSQRCL